MTPVQIPLYQFTNVPAALAAWFAAQPDGTRDVAARWLAGQLGCSRAMVWNLVSGARKVHPEQVPSLARALAFDEEQREYLRRLVAVQNAGPESLKEAQLAMWELHAVHNGIPSGEITAVLEREHVPGADAGALTPLVALLDAIGGCPAPRELAPLLLAPPAHERFIEAVELRADGFCMGRPLSPRLIEIGGAGLPGDAPTAAWHGLLDQSRECLLRVPAEQRDYHAIIWSSDRLAPREALRLIRRLGTDLRDLVRGSAEAPVDRLHLLLFEQLRLTRVLGRDGPKNRPAAGTDTPGLPSGHLSSRTQEGSVEPTTLTGASPCLYLHLDFASYARSWIAARRDRGEPHSAGWLARRMGVSRTTANDLTTGATRFRSTYVAAASRAFNWTEPERVYAEGLARFAEATDPEERARLLHALHAYATAQGVRTYEGEAFRAASSWAALAIHALSFLPSFRTNPAWISCALRGRIRWQDAEELTKTLLAVGTLEARPGGPARPAVYETLSSVSADQPGVARHVVYDGALTLCQSELLFPSDDQHFNGWALALPDTALPAVALRLARFKADLLACYQAADARADAGQGPLDRVMLAGFQFFPATFPLATFIGPRRRRR